MDPTQIKKIQAMKRYRRHQFLYNFYFYSLITLTCILFCSIPLLLPYFASPLREFFIVCVPSFVSALLDSTFLFIVGNLIIVVLIVNSRVFSSKSSSSTSDVYYDEFINSRVERQIQRPQAPTSKFMKAREMEEQASEYADVREGEVEEENADGEEGEVGLASDSDELSKRADVFIARVNEQRKLELSLLQCSSFGE
ncbi:uncharacterized protein LOC129321009 [Prosopis cineraria]|uniref:uncharacterized protein LOC129321009 n=1 Tax=Prosopis cineraria TaxID=364024 RepID=UPI00240EC964|nr:uncharacterized protein LOC129321009 [Prosopis cineraria]